MSEITFNKTNFRKLIKIKEYAEDLQRIAYIASKSSIDDVKENLEKLGNRAYQFRNELFENTLINSDFCSNYTNCKGCPLIDTEDCK